MNYLRSVADALMKFCNPHAVCGRMGGDEYLSIFIGNEVKYVEQCMEQ